MSFMHLRIARPVTDLQHSCQLYTLGLGLKKLADFTDHDGFSGMMLGLEELHWHLELTTCHSHPVKPSQTEEDLLVLYYPNMDEWRRVCERMSASGFRSVPAFNPYWDVNGRTFVDGDGYRTVIQNSAWPILERG